MFVNSESADNAMQILQSVFDALSTRKNLSELDVKVKDSIQEAIMELAQKPFKPYSDIQSAVGNYVELRDLLSVDRKSWEDYESMVKDEMTRISMYLRDKGDEFGVDSFSTPYGTAYRNVKTSYRIESWEDYSAWMRDTNNMQCVEKRPAKLAVKDVIDECGYLPPGLTEFVEVEFNVRRPTKGKAGAPSAKA